MDNPPTFADTDDNISGRSKTTAAVVWNNIEKWTGVTKERRIDIGKAVIGDLVKDRAISWGFGTWCSKNPWKEVSDGSYTLVHEGTSPTPTSIRRHCKPLLPESSRTVERPFRFRLKAPPIILRA
jgi:hypothetical protein